MEYEEIVKSIIKKHFKTEKYSSKQVSDQGEDHTFIVNIENNSYVLKFSSNPWSVPHTIHALKNLEKFDFVPKIIARGKKGKYNYLIKTLVPGETKKLNKQRLKKLLTQVLKVHSVETKKPGYVNKRGNWKTVVKNEIIKNFEEKFYKNCNDKKYIEYALNNIPIPDRFVLLHGDLLPSNILFYRNKCYLFDFEGCFYGEPEYDLGYLHYDVLFSDKKLDLIAKLTNYDKEKIKYYALCVGIRKVALAKKKELNNRIKKLQNIHENLKQKAQNNKK